MKANSVALDAMTALYVRDKRVRCLKKGLDILIFDGYIVLDI